MPRSLVSNQANEDVVRGFQLGFTHASSLIQSRQQQEAEMQREQYAQDQLDKRQQEKFKEDAAVAAMKRANDAKDFKALSAQERTDYQNNALLNDVSDRIHARIDANTVYANSDDILNAGEYRAANEREQQKLAALDVVKPEADGVYDPNKFDAIAQPDPSYQSLAPKWKPEVLAKEKKAGEIQDLTIQQKKASINHLNASTNKIRSGGRGGGLSAKQIQSAHNAFTANHDQYLSAIPLYDNSEDEGGEKYQKANKWNAGSIPMLDLLTDPEYVGTSAAALASGAKQKYNNWQRPSDLEESLKDLYTSGQKIPEGSPEADSFNKYTRPAIQKLQSIITGEGLPNDDTDTGGDDDE